MCTFTFKHVTFALTLAFTVNGAAVSKEQKEFENSTPILCTVTYEPQKDTIRVSTYQWRSIVESLPEEKGLNIEIKGAVASNTVRRKVLEENFTYYRVDAVELRYPNGNLIGHEELEKALQIKKPAILSTHGPIDVFFLKMLNDEALTITLKEKPLNTFSPTPLKKPIFDR